MIEIFHKRLLNHESLTAEEAESLLGLILDDQLQPVPIASIMTALHMKGETTDEIYGFVRAMQQRMRTIAHRRMVIDTCGTGGDHSGTFNISTATALLTAACGVPVAKHGNRAASSQSGSADVLEALGVPIELQPEQAEAVLEQAGMVFLFAPIYHPSLKPLMMVRKQLGFRTIFNLLGPLLNPAQVRRQIIGVPSPEVAEILIEVAKRLSYDDLLIVTNEESVDEMTLSAPAQVTRLRNGQVDRYQVQATDLGFVQAPVSELRGGDPEESAQIIRSVMHGETGPHQDVVVLNTAFALQVGAYVQSPEEGVELARKTIDSGQAAAFLKRYITISQEV